MKKCKYCKHWIKYEDNNMKCAFYSSMPKTTDGEMFCDIDNIEKFGFEAKQIKFNQTHNTEE